MTVSLYLPLDEFDDGKSNFGLAADYLELTAFFSKTSIALTSDLINTSEIAAEQDYDDVDNEITTREEIVSATIQHIQKRMQALSENYPFTLDPEGTVISFATENLTRGASVYLLCLVLSHLKPVSNVMQASEVYPSREEERLLRQYFQYCATAALAAEIRGQAWSFGFPRLDKSGFLTKLKEIWAILRDGRIDPSNDAPTSPKDDQVDVFAARMHPDGQPGFLLAAAQVATGSDWEDKSLRHHIDKVFCRRWFSRPPATVFICYHIIPFLPSEKFFPDNVALLGNILHRLRVPYRVQEATSLVQQGLSVEAFDKVAEVAAWIQAFRLRALELP